MAEPARGQAPERIEYWVPDTLEMVTSKRKYIKVSTIRGEVENRDYGYRREVGVDLTLYLDVESGIVVWDVETYERSL